MSRTRKRESRETRGKCHELVMPNAPDSLHDIRAFAASTLGEMALGRTVVWDIVLAIGEAATNCVLHGQARDGIHSSITTKIQPVSDGVRITLQDEGEGFFADVGTWPVPDLSSEKGRGIFIMKTLMDDVAYPRVPRGTCCVLTKYVDSRH